MNKQLPLGNDEGGSMKKKCTRLLILHPSAFILSFIRAGQFLLDDAAGRTGPG